MYGSEIWDSFKLPGAPPEPMGVYENQPSPVAINVSGIWVAFGALVIFLLAIVAGFDMRAKKQPVLHETYQYNRVDSKSEPSFLTHVFDLTAPTPPLYVK